MLPCCCCGNGPTRFSLQKPSLVVGDDDLTKFKITPYVAFKIQIPDSIDKSFYDGHVFVILKNTFFQPRSPMRHFVEISKIILDQGNPMLVMFRDGGDV